MSCSTHALSCSCSSSSVIEFKTDAIRLFGLYCDLTSSTLWARRGSADKQISFPSLSVRRTRVSLNASVVMQNYTEGEAVKQGSAFDKSGFEVEFQPHGHTLVPGKTLPCVGNTLFAKLIERSFVRTSATMQMVWCGCYFSLWVSTPRPLRTSEAIGSMVLLPWL